MSQQNSGSFEGFRRWRGSILVTQRNLDYGSCSLKISAVFQVGYFDTEIALSL